MALRLKCLKLRRPRRGARKVCIPQREPSQEASPGAAGGMMCRRAGVFSGLSASLRALAFFAVSANAWPKAQGKIQAKALAKKPSAAAQQAAPQAEGEAGPAKGLFGASGFMKREPAASREEKLKKLKVKSLSDLKALTPFESVSVIQKRYLQKTSRGELNLSLSYLLNNSFFYQMGGKGHVGFFFREKHGFGLEGLGLFRFNRPVSSELEANNIKATNPVWTEFYGGAYYKWSPVFGKFAVLNKKIIYFDMFFKLGAGAAKIKGLPKDLLEELPQGQARQIARTIVASGSFGFGQTFALNKSWGFAWEFQWLPFFYQYTVYGTEGAGKNAIHHDLLLSFGLNYYFPGASDR